MADKRIDAHTNTTTVANVDEFIVDSGANGTRNITYSDLKAQLLGTTSIAAIGNTVTEAIYNVHMDQAVPKIDTTTGVMYLEGGSAFEGNIDSTPTAGSNNAVSSGGTKTYVDSAVSQLNDEIGDNNGTLTQRINLSASGNSSYTVTASSAIMVVQFEGYLATASDVYEANVQVNGLMIGYLGCREGVACSPTKREQIRIPFRVFKNDVIKITLSLVGSAVGYATLYTT